MRLIKSYVFKIGTKIPFSEWPEIVHRFLSENHLVSRRFFYYFEDIIGGNETIEDALPKSGCAKILKDCPSLGEIQYLKRKEEGYSDLLYLSNTKQPMLSSDELILTLMKKIHRRYGFCEVDLRYTDIDFFGRSTSFSDNHYAAGITLHRDACADNYLELSVDILHGGIVMDADPYYEAMKKLLPKIRSSASLTVYLTEEEQQHINEINHTAAPILQKCRDFFANDLPLTNDLPVSQNALPKYSIVKPLKKLAKKYGYTYKLIWSGGVYSIEKRTEKGNVIFIEVYGGPSRYNLGASISYQGAGFKHTLGHSMGIPADQQGTDAFLEHIVSRVAEFENSLLPSLDALYPETPDWFVPSDIP